MDSGCTGTQCMHGGRGNGPLPHCHSLCLKEAVARPSSGARLKQQPPFPPRPSAAAAPARARAAMLLWAFFGITTMAGSAAQMLQRGARGADARGRRRSPEPRDWALRRDAPGPNFARPEALEHDAWARRRAELDEDVWADQRYTIDAPVAGPRVFGNPRRRRYILDSLDGGEAYYRFREGRDMRREKVVPNNGPHRVGRKVAGKWVPVPVVNGRPVEPEGQDAR